MGEGSVTAMFLWIGGMVLFIVCVGVAFREGYKEGYKEGVEDARKDFEKSLYNVVSNATSGDDFDIFGVQSKDSKPTLPKT